MTTAFNAIARLVLGACTAAALIAPLPTQAEDNSVKRRLDSVGQKYVVDKDGDFTDHAGRYRRVSEYIELLRRTWTSWTSRSSWAARASAMA